MKLKHFLKPADTFFSTPKAARRLLRLFAQVLVLGMVLGVAISISSILKDEISRRQDYMSDTVANARAFFIQREALLTSLMLFTLSENGENIEVDSARKNIKANFYSKDWGLHLSGRMVDYLRESQINLVYIPEVRGERITYITNTLKFEKPIPDKIVQRLREERGQNFGSTQDVWLSDVSLTSPRLYLFKKLEFQQYQSGWIGMEMDVSDLQNALHGDSAGQYVIQNLHGDVMISSTLIAKFLSLPTFELENDLSFSLDGLWPAQLIMQKNMGYSGWRVFYAIELSSLVGALLWPLVISLTLVSLLSMLVYRLVLRIDRRLITPATQRIDALIESEAFSRAVIQTSPVALCVLRRADGQVVLENRLSQQWLGECSERERLCHRWIERAFGGQELDQTDEFQAGNGRHLQLSFVGTRYSGEEVLFCAFSDVSTLKQVEAAMTMAKEMADAANEAKTLFLATMSHEIRTPLYGVLGTLELLGRTELKTQQKAYLQAIESSSATLLNLVCDVLDVAKIEAGQLALEVSEFSPTELIYEAVQSYVGAARSKGLYLHSYIDPEIPSRLHGDVIRIRQILNNLLSNAVKFTENGQISLRAKIGVKDGERVEVLWQVSDSGPGISSKDQAFLFDPFYQAVRKTNVVAGTGLGLSICQRLAALMNGSIRVVSATGLGSSFTLCVPLERSDFTASTAQASTLLNNIIYVYSPVAEMSEYIARWLRKWGARPQIGLPENSPNTYGSVLVEVYPKERSDVIVEWQGTRVIISAEDDEYERKPNYWRVKFNDLNGLYEAASRAQGIQNSPDVVSENDNTTRLDMRVLVAEDNAINQLILRDQLEELGCTVSLAKDGREALLLWSRNSFDVILTDINMPGMNGYELAKKLRCQGCTVPIIGATANAMRDESERCLAVGMQQLLVKPFGLSDIFNCLQQYEKVYDSDL
jgi:two-component system capsular synthesis sensor histidine kinase RcsC